MAGAATSLSLSERVATAIFWNTIAFPIKAVIKFVASLVMLWALTREGYGVYQATLGSLVAVVWTYTGLGISATILKFVPEVMARQGRGGVGRFLRSLFGLRLALLGAVVLLLNVFSAEVINYLHLDRYPELGAIGQFLIRSASLVILLRATTDTCYRVLTAYFQQKVTNRLDIVSALVQPLLIVVLVPGANGGWGFGLGLIGTVYALLIGTAVDLILALLAVRSAIRQLPPFQDTFQPVERLWQRFTTSAFINYVMDLSIIITSPDFVALVFLALARAGDLADIEASWNQVMILLTYLIMPLSGIYVPMFSEIFAKAEHEKLQPAYSMLTRVLLLATIPAGIGFIMLAPQAFTLLNLADRYPYAARSAQILTFFMFAESIVVVPHVILMVYERYRVVLLSRMIALLGAPLIVWVVATGSPLAVVLTIGALRFGSRAILTPYASKHFGLRFPWQFALRLLLPSLAFALVLHMLDPWLPVAQSLPLWRNLIHVVIQILLGAVIFVVGFKALGGLDDQDRKRLATLRIPFLKYILRYL